MFQQIFEKIAGIDILPTIALLIFFILFTLIVIWAVLLDPTLVNRMKRMPLEPDHPAKKGESNHG